jgi:hypothetical protein
MFGKTKRQPDSRVRFQNSRFKHRLSEARSYKRRIRNKPFSGGEVFLSKIGLESWFSRFATLLVFLLLIYLVFIPNIFFVDNLIINTPQPADLPVLQNLVNSYLSKKLPLPEKNLVFLSKNGLKNFLLKNDQKILAVNGINKQFPSTLIINITPRVDQFLIQTASSTDFSVANDGLVTDEVFLGASETLPSDLTSIKLDNSDGLIIGRQALNQSQVDFLNLLKAQLPDIAKSPINYFELSDLQTPDLTVYMKSGFKILISLNSDSTQTLNRLRLLFSQFTGYDVAQLSYIDVRFGDNGYTCDKGAPCVQDISIPTTTASSTLSN